MHDANTGKHRSTVDIEKAAKVWTEERPHGPRFVKYQQAVVDRPPAGEEPLVLPTRYLQALTRLHNEWARSCLKDISPGSAAVAVSFTPIAS